MGLSKSLSDLAQASENQLIAYYEIVRVVNLAEAVDFSVVSASDPILVATGLTKAQFGQALTTLEAVKDLLEASSNAPLFTLLRAANVEIE